MLFDAIIYHLASSTHRYEEWLYASGLFLRFHWQEEEEKKKRFVLGLYDTVKDLTFVYHGL